MKLSIFGIIEFHPLWSKQDLDEEYVEIKLLAGIFGFTIIFWALPIVFISRFSVGLLIGSGDQTSSFILTLFGNIFFDIFLGALVSYTVIRYLLPRYHTLFDGMNIVKQYINFQLDMLSYLDNTDDEENAGNPYIRYYTIIGSITGVGALAGLYYTILLFIPIFVIYIFLLFIITYFLALSEVSLFLSMILAWLVVFWWIVTRKLNIMSDEEISKSADYEVTNRRIEILASQQEPIICPACKSFIAAESAICPVCNEILDKTE